MHPKKMGLQEKMLISDGSIHNDFSEEDKKRKNNRELLP